MPQQGEKEAGILNDAESQEGFLDDSSKSPFLWLLSYCFSFLCWRRVIGRGPTSPSSQKQPLWLPLLALGLSPSQPGSQFPWEASLRELHSTWSMPSTRGSPCQYIIFHLASQQPPKVDIIIPWYQGGNSGLQQILSISCSHTSLSFMIDYSNF